jgi:nucleoside-diphosphate-sugar epimerase
MHIWRDQRVIVTGGGGFPGSVVVEKLMQRGCGRVVVPRSHEYDLMTIEAVRLLYDDARPDIVIHRRPGSAEIEPINPMQTASPAAVSM